MKPLYLLPLLLCACTHLEVAKVGATADQIAKDKAECTYEANKATAAVDNPLIMRSQIMKIAAMCMQQKGYAVSASN